jgi:chromosomal replication initiator protein
LQHCAHFREASEGTMKQDARRLWKAILGELQVQVSPANFEYFKDSEGLDLTDGVLRVGVPNAFKRETLAQSRFDARVRGIAARQAGRPVLIRYELLRTAPPAPLLQELEVDDDPPIQLPGRSASGGRQPAGRRAVALHGAYQETLAPLPQPLAGTPLNPRYTFETFIEASSNRLAYGAARAVADSPGHDYNPLFIYGDTGLGKTHLLHAIAHAALARHLPIIYTTSEIFTNELIDAIRDRRTDEFRQKYRHCRVLLIDDIQTLEGKERTQEEFFHTFNAIHGAGGHIVLSSDRPPSDIPHLEQRLRSRFEWGLIADIKLPDLESRIAILSSKLNGRASEVTPEILELLASRVQRNIREMEGAFNRVEAYARMHGLPLSLPVAEAALASVASSAAPRAGDVLRAVSHYYRVSLDELKSSTRAQRIAHPRQVGMYLLREDIKLSLPEIGRQLGDRDHTTVMHGIKKVAARIPSDTQLRSELQAIRDLVRSS